MSMRERLPYLIRLTLEDMNGSLELYQYSPTESTTPLNDQHSSKLIRWSSLLLTAFLLLGSAGNALVCIAISTDRRLQNVTNYFLFSLAVADLLVSLIVMPFSILTELHNGSWYYGFPICAGYIYADVFLCSASIVHMSVISLDRYLGISRPLKTRNKSKLVVTMKIITVWAITTMISCPIIVLAVAYPNHIHQDNSCSITNRYFMIYGSTLAFLIPCLIMVATFVRTTQLLRQQALLCTSSGSESVRSANGAPVVSLRRSRTRPARIGGSKRRYSSESRRSITSRKESVSFGSISDSGGVQHKRSFTNRMNAIQIDRLQVVLPIMTANRRNSLCSENSIDIGTPIRFNPSQTPTRKISTVTEKTLSKKFRDTTITLWNKTKRSTSANELANEQKATRVLGLVFGCFVICWTPFFVQNFTLAFCGEKCPMPHWLTSTFLWLGYISSTINPIIYTIFNKRFREAFTNILTCRCIKLHRDGQSRPSRASASSFHSVNSNYYYGAPSNGITGASLATNGHGGMVGSYTKFSITRIPLDQIDGLC